MGTVITILLTLLVIAFVAWVLSNKWWEKSKKPNRTSTRGYRVVKRVRDNGDIEFAVQKFWLGTGLVDEAVFKNPDDAFAQRDYLNYREEEIQ